MSTVQRFPALVHVEEDDNAAIQIFGRRFYKDQTAIEYLVEFFLVFLSPKYVEDPKAGWQKGFPDKKILDSWPANSALKYSPEPRLGLKLFSFLGSSKLETRHACHKQHFEKMLSNLKEQLEIDTNISEDELLEILEQLLCGFVGVAANRTWCTQVFLPVSECLVAGETIWKRVKGDKSPDITWSEAIDKGLFSFSKHAFLVRGGEVLYLQLCNLKRFFGTQELEEFEIKNGFAAGEGEDALVSISEKLEGLFQQTRHIDELCKWVENADTETASLIRRQDAQCGWCPEESWREAYLFAYEFANICRSSIDPLEKTEMLTLCCVFQVLRSLCSQACRYSGLMTEDLHDLGGANGFSWIITAEQLDDTSLKETAKRNLIRIQEIIHSALRHPDIQSPHKPKATDEKKADAQGHELFVQLAKRIGFIVPRVGPGARMVLSDTLLRYMVLALIPPGESRTTQSFEERLNCHYGIAINGKILSDAVRWTYRRETQQAATPKKNWIEENLLAAGFLIPLSDAVSQVKNPFN